MADISAPALEKAKAKVLQLVPDAPRVETKVSNTGPFLPLDNSARILTTSLVY